MARGDLWRSFSPTSCPASVANFDVRPDFKVSNFTRLIIVIIIIIVYLLINESNIHKEDKKLLNANFSKLHASLEQKIGFYLASKLIGALL